MKNNFNHPLMDNNITNEDISCVIKFLKKNRKKIFTQSIKVKEFEKKWSEWLGVKHSIFVNSGSSANLLSILALKILKGKGEVIVPTLTWVSDIAALIHTGFTPIFADIDPRTLAMASTEIMKKVNEKTRAVFLSHIQGFNGLTDELLKFLDNKRIPLIEDVCESHGATHNDQRVGSFGLMSNFSFYYAHHMSTIEGGMVCTNDEEVYETLRMLRSHGMVRESSNQDTAAKFHQNHPDLNPQFIFAHAAYNMRNNEIGAILGRHQLKKLDENNLIRSRNQEHFLTKINNKVFQTDFLIEGSSNYAFNLVLKEKDDKLMSHLMQTLKENGVEFRRGSAGGGNQLRQPYLQNLVEPKAWKQYPVTEHIHFYGMYIGNFPNLPIDEVDEITHIINSAVE